MNAATATSLGPELAGKPACSWCGLHVARLLIHGSPTCAECNDAGPRGRVTAYIKRLQRAAKETR